MAFVTCPKLREEACQAGCQVLGPGGGCLPRGLEPSTQEPPAGLGGGRAAAAALLPGSGGGELALAPGVGGCGPRTSAPPLSLSLWVRDFCARLFSGRPRKKEPILNFFRLRSGQGF